MSRGNEILGARLKSLRLAAGISQRTLGILAGINPNVASARINRYEQAVHAVDFSIAQNIARCLDAPAAYLYVEDEQLAELILTFYRCSPKSQQQIIEFTRGLVTND